MGEKMFCPMCNLQYTKNALICEHCGVDLALASLIENNESDVDFQSSLSISVSPEILVPRLGDYLVEKNTISKENLEEALAYQKENNTVANPVLLGESMVELNFIDRNTLDNAITRQIFDLQNALKKSNSDLEQRVDERTKELKIALEKLTELNQLKSNFISNISHELRTPLAHIIGYVDLLKDESLGPITIEQKKAFQVISKSNNRLYSLIDNLVQFSLLSSGKLPLVRESVQASELINKSVIKNKIIAKKNNINLKFINCSEDITIYVDIEKISWVLDQILDNAISFNKQPGHILLNTSIEDDMLTLYVQDSGIGIAKENLEEIFEAFHQLDSSATRKVGGTGLGLNLVKQILNAHESTIFVESKVGEGSIFKFSLPIT